jgi:hypothetical protein
MACTWRLGDRAILIWSVFQRWPWSCRGQSIESFLLWFGVPRGCTDLCSICSSLLIVARIDYNFAGYDRLLNLKKLELNCFWVQGSQSWKTDANHLNRNLIADRYFTNAAKVTNHCGIQQILSFRAASTSSCLGEGSSCSFSIGQSCKFWAFFQEYLCKGDWKGSD